MAMESNFLASLQRTSQDLAAVAIEPAKPKIAQPQTISPPVPRKAIANPMAPPPMVGTMLPEKVVPAKHRIRVERRSTTVYLNDADYMRPKLLAVRERRTYHLAVLVTILPLWRGEIYGAGRVFLGGFALFTVAPAVSAFAGNLLLLILAGFAQGLGGGAFMALGMMNLRRPVNRDALAT